MKAATGFVFSMVWMIMIMMIGFIVVSNLQLHANDTGALNGTAGTTWANFISYVWVAFTILALLPLVMVAVIFGGLIGGIGGKD